jgi:predicted outer membrane repeat protein
METRIMSFQTWLRTLRFVLTRREAEGRRRRTPHHHPAARFRPRLETLENRLTPTNYNVIATADPIENGGELRGYVAAANANPDPNGDTITLSPGVYQLDGQSVVADGMLIITDPNLIIQGAGQGTGSSATVLEDEYVGPAEVFVVGGNVNLSGMTIQNSECAVLNGSGTVHLTNCDLVGNVQGLSGSGSATLTNCNLSGNSGGAISFSGSTLSLTNCTLSGNSAGQGGGIYESGATVTVNGGSVSGNTAAEGAGIFANGGTVTLTGVTLSDNTATANGGAIYGDPAVVTITSCTFSGNTAPAGADLYNLNSSVALLSTNLNGVANNGGTITLIDSSISGVSGSGGTVTDPIANLLAQVAALDLNSGQRNSLSSTLQAAQQSLTRANTTAAVNQLGAFVNQVNALVNSHRLGQITADTLVGEVDDLLSFLP